MSQAEQAATHSFPHRTVEQAILDALKGLRYGSVEILIHDSKVVQIERREKTRFDQVFSLRS
ncbi:MAG: YezD family protein [Nitrospira sp.]|nr:YezD family protein [Nitrospira sp.]